MLPLKGENTIERLKSPFLEKKVLHPFFPPNVTHKAKNTFGQVNSKEMNLNSDWLSIPFSKGLSNFESGWVHTAVQSG